MTSSPQPSTELISMVAFIAEMKDCLPVYQRGFLNTYGFYVQMRKDSKELFAHYKAGGRFISKLEFSGLWGFLEKPQTVGEAQLRVTKYNPGDWEEKVKPTYVKAQRIDEALRLAGQAMKSGDTQEYDRAQEAFEKALKED